MTVLRALVVTVVHHPADARIRARQIEALLSAGWEVTYAAPFSGYGLPVPAPSGGLTCVDVPRARGRRRLAPVRPVRRLVRAAAADHDVVLVHDPEIVPALAGLTAIPVVWDVHEDPGAAMEVKEWLPGPLRRPAASAVRVVERLAERRMPLLLADHRYADRFARTHPVVPNTTVVPADPPPAGQPDGDGALRVVYLGSITLERGAEELIRIAAALRTRSGAGHGIPPIRLEVIGGAHGSAEGLLTAAADRGDLTWTGYVPNVEALTRVEGALAGLSPLHDRPNFRGSMPTKVVEYLARGVPVITTPLPVAVDLVERSGGGVVVPFGDVERTVEQVLAWAGHPEDAVRIGRSGHALVRDELDWAGWGPRFVDELVSIVRSARERGREQPGHV